MNPTSNALPASKILVQFSTNSTPISLNSKYTLPIPVSAQFINIVNTSGQLLIGAPIGKTGKGRDVSYVVTYTNGTWNIAMVPLAAQSKAQTQQS